MDRPTRKTRFPLYLQVLIGVVLGSALGVTFGDSPYFLGLRNEDLSKLGMTVIRLLKALAVPLVFFAILDAFVQTRISWRNGSRLIVICAVNVSVAMLIGLTLMNGLEPGVAWQGHLEELTGITAGAGTSSAAPALGSSAGASLDVLSNVRAYVPESLLDPLLKNNIISVVLMAILFGAALRHVRERGKEQGGDAGSEGEVMSGVVVLEHVITSVYHILLQALEWVVRAVPFAVFGVVAHVVGRSGLEVFAALWSFLAVILLGMAIHALVYYPLIAWVVGKKSPREYLGHGADAILTGLSTNSSLATVPVTLRCLTEKLGISDASARLAACVGTNLNNDGITLYEAMAALFLAQACGAALGLEQQVVLVLAAIMAGIGVAGIPEAGLVVLPLVLAAVGLPEETIALLIPLIIPVDWILARCRSAVNVMSDMVVAILLDAGAQPMPEPAPESALPSPPASMP